MLSQPLSLHPALPHPSLLPPLTCQSSALALASQGQPSLPLASQAGIASFTHALGEPGSLSFGMFMVVCNYASISTIV